MDSRPHRYHTDNELANTDAIRAADEEMNDIQHPKSTRDAIKLIETYTNNLWQTEWNASTKGEHYRNIEPVVTRQIKLIDQNRKREVIQTRLRLGKCNMNSYLKIMNRHRDGNCGHLQYTRNHRTLYFGNVKTTPNYSNS